MFALNNNDNNGHQSSTAYLNILIYICLRVCSEIPWSKQWQNKSAQTQQLSCSFSLRKYINGDNIKSGVPVL